MDNIYLVGSEDVKRASNNIQSSAEIMQSVANNISNSLSDYQIFMNEWLDRFEVILKENR